MATLLLRLAAPLQAWGDECKFEMRRTMSFPTKSGVLGMLAAAMGYSRDIVPPELNQLKFGIRVDCEGKIRTDYQTVINTEDRKKSYVTRREYLEDAIFLAGLESEDVDYLQQLEQALLSPVYPLYLGRRSCPPTMPLVLGIRETDLLTSLRNEDWLFPVWRQRKMKNSSDCRLRIIADCDPTENGTILRDVPVSFSRQHRKFGWRNVKEYDYVEKIPIVAEHDPMKELKSSLPEITKHNPIEWK